MKKYPYIFNVFMIYVLRGWYTCDWKAFFFTYRSTLFSPIVTSSLLSNVFWKTNKKIEKVRSQKKWESFGCPNEEIRAIKQAHGNLIPHLQLNSVSYYPLIDLALRKIDFTIVQNTEKFWRFVCALEIFITELSSRNGN